MPPGVSLFADEVGKRWGVTVPVTAELEQALAQALATARRAWPSFQVGAEDFIVCLAQHVDSRDVQGPGLARELREWEHIPDLYLAWACARGDRLALQAFDEHLIHGLAGVARRLERAGVPLEDVQQALREKLFVGRDGKPPGILDYGGHGPLKSWVFVVAARVALNLLRAVKTPAPDDEEKVLALQATDANQELAYLKNLYREEFASALKLALGGLSSRDKNLLRQHYLDGVTLTQLARLYGVHRVTLVHWAQRARSALRDRTLELLLERLGVSPGTLHSIARLVQSQFGASLQGVLADAPAPEL